MNKSEFNLNLINIINDFLWKYKSKVFKAILEKKNINIKSIYFVHTFDEKWRVWMLNNKLQHLYNKILLITSLSVHLKKLWNLARENFTLKKHLFLS